MNAMTMVAVNDGLGGTRHILAPASAAPKKKGRKASPPDPMKTNGEAGPEQARLIIERVERLEEGKQEIADDIADVWSEAKATGFDVKTMKTIVKLRKMEKHHRDEAEEMLDTYMTQLGMR